MHLDIRVCFSDVTLVKVEMNIETSDAFEGELNKYFYSFEDLLIFTLDTFDFISIFYF